MNEPESIKVVLVGESDVGKTSIMSQFTSNIFDPHRVTKPSAQFVSKTIEFAEFGKSIKFDIWDTVGQVKYRSLARIFYKDAKVTIFVYDITSIYSFEQIKLFWYNEVKENCDTNPILAVVANKYELYAQLKVNNSEGKAFADKIGAFFQWTTSFGSGNNYLFDNIGRACLDPTFDYKKLEEKEVKIREEYKKKKKKIIKLETKLDKLNKYIKI